jgi:hypothetical protein
MDALHVKLFGAMRDSLTLPYRKWPVHQFLRASIHNIVPQSFGFHEDGIPNLGKIVPQDSQFLWGVIQLLTRAMENDGVLKAKHKQNSWDRHVEILPMGWVKLLVAVLAKETPLIHLAIYPEPASRLVAKMLVEHCGYKRTWEYTKETQLFWLELTKVLMQSNKDHFPLGINDSEVVAMQRAVTQLGFEASWQVGYSMGLFGQNQIQELFRLSWSLCRRGLIPSVKGRCGFGYIENFWSQFMHDPAPKELLELMSKDIVQMPIYIVGHPNGAHGFLAGERVRLCG